MTMTASPSYRIRPYDPSRDRTSLEEICANIYGGSDYLPKMATTYVNDDSCSFLALATNREGYFQQLEKEDEQKDDAIVAVANYKRLPAQNSAWIEAVRTHSGYRNQGLASKLLQSIVELAKEEDRTNKRQSPTNILTCTVKSNVGMKRVFDKLGFVQTNRISILSFAALQQLLELLKEMQSEGGTCGFLPGLHEYIVPGPNRLDLKQSMEQGLVLALNIPLDGKEMSGCDEETTDRKKERAILAFTRDDRISSLKSNWVCSISAHSTLAFEAALHHAHSSEIAQRINGSSEMVPFCLTFDDAVPVEEGTVAYELPRVDDDCVVFSYKHV